MPPHYSPDGTWFWTGTRWIPADQVQNPPPAPIATEPAPRRPAWRRRHSVAAALVAVLVVSVSLGIVTMRPGRGGKPAPQTLAVPPAQTIFSLPFTDGLDSAEFEGTLTHARVTETVIGVLDFAPGRALHAALYEGRTAVGEILDCAGVDYQLQEPGGPWVATPQVSDIDSALGWAGVPPPGLRVAGWQVVGGETAWDLKSSSGAEWWIGARTGHPLRFKYRSSGWNLALRFDGFNNDSPITVPPRVDVSTAALQGSPGAVVAGPGLAVKIDAVDLAPRGLPAPPAGYLYKALYLSYWNRAPAPTRLDNPFTLTDAYGAVYPEASGVQVAPALPRHQTLAPGQAVSGWDVFLVARQAWALTLQVGPPPGRQNADFLITIPLS